MVNFLKSGISFLTDFTLLIHNPIYVQYEEPPVV